MTCLPASKLIEIRSIAKMIPEHPNQISRTAAVLALIGSLIWVQWPIDFAKINIGGTILFIAALATWISVEISYYSRESKYNDNIISDDVSKINSIISIIDKNQYYTLRQKAIQTYMDEDDYDGIRNIIYYRENDLFPFHNQRIQALYENFSAGAKKFHSDFYSLYTSDGRGRSTWRESGNRYVSDEIYEKVMAKIAKLDKQASELADLWEKLIKVSREELKGASTPMERYDL